MTDAEEPDFDDDEVFDAWCAELRSEVAEYLESEGREHGEVLEWPAWNVAPHVAIWAVESADRPGYVGGWVLCGNLPMDYLEGEGLTTPREAMAAFVERWTGLVADLKAGNAASEFEIEGGEDPAETAAMMENRVGVLRELVEDDEAWIPEESE